MPVRKKKRIKLDDPKPNGKNGRRRDGKFAPGNQAARGRPNPFARKQTELRKALYEEASPEDVRAVLRRLLDAALRGEPWAIKECGKRLIGDAFIAPVSEPYQVELDGDEIDRRIRTADAMRRLSDHDGRTLSEQVIGDFEVLFEDGLDFDAVAGIAGMSSDVLKEWATTGETILTGRQKAKTNADELSVMLIRAQRRGEAKHRRRLLEAQRVALLERIDPKNYATRDAESETEEYDPDDRFI